MKKGITAASVAVMVLVIMILVGTITTLSYNSIENASKISFSLEISNLQENVDKYISDNVTGDYPILGNEYLINLTDVSSTSISQFAGETQNANNEITVYELDLSALGIRDTVYGNKKTEKDVYVVSKTTGRIYYIEGIKTKEITYYTLTDELLELKDKKAKKDEQAISKKPVISTDGFITKVLSNGVEEVYLSNIKVDNSIKKFKYEIGIIPEDIVKEYFEEYGKSIIGDRIKLETMTEITLYAESENGEYDVLYYTNTYGFVKANTKEAIEAGIKIGDTVTGYTLDSSKKSYTTSGKENTAVTMGPNIAQADSPQTVNQTVYSTWKYIGISDDGEILIAPDMPATGTVHTMRLSGKGGYLNGPAELDKVCNGLYSTDKGTARSMNIEDVNRILNFTGPKGKYTDVNGNVVTTSEAKKLSELGITTGYTPDGKPIGDYYANAYTVSNGSATDEAKSLVYTNKYYWLASSCVNVDLKQSVIHYRVRYGTPNGIASGWNLYSSSDSSDYVNNVVRPVVHLKSNVQLTKVSEGRWSI